MEEDIDEANLNHLLEKLSECGDSEFACTVAAVRELINAINLKLMAINKRSKKNTKGPEQPQHAPGRSGDRR
ncbi:subunit of the poxvirus multiprotein entry-fusion complex [Squirrelpox virus]|uniref:O5L n=1 Tax=Squirrelpox virus TaxID=240426 RepID=Q6VFR1_9POXV|nr:subunit of the poxvirus multiprotein entry-fusion complex [Squirrelpox virus]AAQ24199.1 putative A30L protein [Squirrelpox virus]ABD51470.1 O5L [Squirrelpox virus]CCD83302.1 subunit of the poxvirus multiprotein entry-fusion complex [Squirrelpox virus]